MEGIISNLGDLQLGALIAGEVFLYPRSHGLLFLVTLFRCDDEGGGGGGVGASNERTLG